MRTAPGATASLGHDVSFLLARLAGVEHLEVIPHLAFPAADPPEFRICTIEPWCLLRPLLFSRATVDVSR